MSSSRPDGRSPAAIREINIAYDGLSAVDGSTRFSFGPSCTALASVSGPIAARLTAENPARATVEVHVRPLSSVPGTHERSVAAVLRGIIERECALNQNPRTLVQVVVQALSADVAGGSLVAAQINACTLALMNAGSVPMRGVVCAVGVGRVRNGGEVRMILDPSEEEAASMEGGGCFAFIFATGLSHASNNDMPSSDVVWTNYHTTPGTTFDESELVQAKELARQGAVVVWESMKKSLGDEEEDGVKMEI
ncbi:ribosomal protein S5 domain 2-like protein [Leucogyrophana mollusca]|uniref:Ribosomal protein S5 domain 2-like protein n=1 Tax=Leucogyrophana mollusca TaxID=85980 RepID=A0ACB8AWP5_9AGAM|nr:ribosomal protein S5 domain 2-like protein [Leucogyrophana mollusca]